MPSSARNRTVAHMHHMIAATTATTAALGCTRASDVQTVTIQPEPLPTVPASVSAEPAPPRPDPTVSATVAQPDVPDPPPNPPPNPTGYLVVDMLPAPARCMGVAGATTAHAVAHRGGHGIVLELVVTLPTKGALSGVRFNGTASAWSSKVVGKTFRSHSTVAVVVVQLASGTVTSLGVTLGVDCGGRGTGSLAVTATFPTAPTHGSVPQLALQDY
jgi:hypothetical protein